MLFKITCNNSTAIIVNNMYVHMFLPPMPLHFSIPSPILFLQAPARAEYLKNGGVYLMQLADPAIYKFATEITLKAMETGIIPQGSTSDESAKNITDFFFQILNLIESKQ